MVAVLDKTEIIILESNIIYRFFGKLPENFHKFSGIFSGEYFSGKLISLTSALEDALKQVASKHDLGNGRESVPP